MKPPSPPLWRLKSALPGAIWPVVPAPGPANALALLHQFEQAQWLDSATLEALQLQQLDAVLKHAWNSVPWYRQRWAGLFDPSAPVTLGTLARLPTLSRRDLQDGFAALTSSAYPAQHGPTRRQSTSGSTGAPVSFLTTGVTSLYWNVATLRDHLWHRRDLSQKLAVVRFASKPGRASNWGPATAGVAETGPAVGHSIQTSTDELLRWLDDERPAYLFTHPSMLESLARLSLERGQRLDGLREVRTLAEALGPELRELCRDAWGVPLTDLYSCTEAGYLALQCPDRAHYHVQSEGVLVEIRRDDGRLCGPGEVGRVLVTTLQNFAMPLIRYDIGDYAEVGPPCPCGRGLPVLTRILGRVRNLLTTADGKTYWPAFGMTRIRDRLPAIRQWQFVQKSTELLEARLVADPALTPDQERLVHDTVLAKLPPGFALRITYHPTLERTAGGKFEDFYSEVTRSAQGSASSIQPDRA